MKGSLFIGMAVGAMLGAVLVESSPEVKKIVKDGKAMVDKQMKAKTK